MRDRLTEVLRCNPLPQHVRVLLLGRTDPAAKAHLCGCSACGTTHGTDAGAEVEEFVAKHRDCGDKVGFMTDHLPEGSH